MLAVPVGPYHLTPKPGFNEYDPEDWFDLRDDPVEEIRPISKDKENWFDLPYTEAIQRDRYKKFYAKKDYDEYKGKKHPKYMRWYNFFSDSEDY